MTWRVVGLLIATVDLTTVLLGGGNIFFGHSDTNATSSSDPNDADLLFTLIDNVRVVPAPDAPGLLLAGALALALRHWRGSAGGPARWRRSPARDPGRSHGIRLGNPPATETRFDTKAPLAATSLPTRPLEAVLRRVLAREDCTMLRRSSTPSAFLLALGLVAALAGASRPASATSIHYGDHLVAGAIFQQVTESSSTDPVPLYGPPSAYVLGMDFDPIGFVATSVGGAVADVTDGQLNFSVLATDPLVSFDSISLFEAGDYSLAGVGTAATSVFSGASLRVLVTQLNGVDVAPIALVPVNGSFGDSLPGTAVLQPWSLGLFLDIATQLGQGQRATRIEVVIDNQLLALSEPGSLAFIAKKDFRIDVGTGRLPPIPEPSALLMLLSACLAIPAAARRRG